MRRTAALLLVGIVLSIVPSAARAEPTELDRANARALFNEGLDLRKSGDHVRALERLAAADALSPTPKTRLEVAREKMTLGRWVEAHAALLSVANVEPREDPKYQQVRAEATSLADEIGPRIPTLRFVLPEGTTPEIAVDGITLPEAARGVPRRVDPGEHTIVVTWLDRRTTTARVTVAAGQARDVVFTPPVVAIERVVAARNPDQPPSYRTAAWITSAGGVALLGAGAIFALGARSTYADARPYCDGDLCDPEGLELRARARTQGAIATTLLGVGAVAVATGVVLFVVSPREKSTVGVSAGLRGLAIMGTF
jgi:hypothetical protein